VTRKPPRQVEHLVGINDVRVAVEVKPQQVAYFFACWELPALGWVHPVIPDALLGLRLPERRTFFLEYDRATETLPTLLGKLRGYDSGLSGIPFRALLLVADTAARLETLGRHVRKEGFLRRILGCVRSELSAAGIDAPSPGPSSHRSRQIFAPRMCWMTSSPDSCRQEQLFHAGISFFKELEICSDMY